MSNHHCCSKLLKSPCTFSREHPGTESAKITDLQQTKDRETKLLACKRFHLWSLLSNPSRLMEAVNERREHAGAAEEGKRQAAPWDEWGHPSSSGSAATKDCIFEGWCHRTQAAWEQSRLLSWEREAGSTYIHSTWVINLTELHVCMWVNITEK